LDPADRTRFLSASGTDALVNDQTTDDLVFRLPAPLPARVRASVKLPKFGASGFGLPGGATLVARDTEGGGWVGVVSAEGDALAAVSEDTWRGPGQWHELEFAAGAGGVEEVLLDGVRVLGGVELPAGGGDWLRLRGDVGPGGLADVRLKVAHTPSADGDSMLPDAMVLSKTLWGGIGPEGVTLRGAGSIPLGGTRQSAAKVHGRLRFEAGTEATLWIGDVGIAIAEGRDLAPTTGSILGESERSVRLVPPGTWYDLEIRMEAACLVVALNGVEVARGCLGASGDPLRIDIDRGALDIGSLTLQVLPAP
jgi:hypothetical protein